MRAAGKTDIGKNRIRNEDAIMVSIERKGLLPNIFIVADGMGGHSSGDVASKESIKAFCEYISGGGNYEQELLDTLVSAVSFCNERICKLSADNPEYEGMGTTFTAAVIDSVANKLYVAHVGDTRLYVIREGIISQITTDHTFVNELLKAGKVTTNEARMHPRRNLITRAVGRAGDADIDGIVFQLQESDTVLISSDGLTNMVTDEKILEIINLHADINEALETLINEANANGGTDNISAVLINYER